MPRPLTFPLPLALSGIAIHVPIISCWVLEHHEVAKTIPPLETLGVFDLLNFPPGEDFPLFFARVFRCESIAPREER